MPIRRASGARCTCGLSTTSPDRRTSPALARSRPATARSRVVLPQPEGPISTPMLPSVNPSETSSTAGRSWPRYRTLTRDSSTCMSPILDEYNSHLRWCRSSAAGGGARPIPSMTFARLQDFLLLGLAALIVLPVAAVVGSWLQWDAQSAAILREMAATVLP